MKQAPLVREAIDFKPLLVEAKNTTASSKASDVVTGQMNLAVAKPQQEHSHYQGRAVPTPLYFHMYDGVNARGSDNALESAFNEQVLNHMIGKGCHALTCKGWMYWQLIIPSTSGKRHLFEVELDKRMEPDLISICVVSKRCSLSIIITIKNE